MGPHRFVPCFLRLLLTHSHSTTLTPPQELNHSAAHYPYSLSLPHHTQELLDHSAAHHAALTRLLSAVSEVDKGRPSLIFSRNQSIRPLPLFADLTQGRAQVWGGAWGCTCS